MDFTTLRYDTLDSTNTEAVSLARQGAEEGLCIIAREQTAGRGRQGRAWVSAKESGLYFSVVLRPKIEMKFLPLITLMTGVAVHDLLASFRLKPDIKWVNDILVGEKKISGILAETVDTASGLAVIVGIGINLKIQNFSDDLANIGTSIEAELGTDTVSITHLEDQLKNLIAYWYGILLTDDGHSKIINHWSLRSSYFSGKPVRVTLDGNTFVGITHGLEENGALRVKTADGSVKIVQAGDVERLRASQDP